MTNKVFFMNDAEFDPVAMLTFGVSAKETDTAIGFFGTGFKYAVAIILKLGGSIRVDSNGNEYVFERRTETIRGSKFEVVYMNGQNAGFTTHLGANWEPWMAFRELFSNCLDEKGEVSEERQDKGTVVEVDCHLIYNAFMDAEKYFILDKPFYDGKNISLHKGNGNFVYYRGVAVYSVETNFRINIKTHVDLSEERTSKYIFQWIRAIAKEVQSMADESLIRTFLTSDFKTDRTIDYDANYPMSDEFLTTAKMLLRTDQGLPESARIAIRMLDEKAGVFPELLLTKPQLMMLERATNFLSGIGVNVIDFEIKTVNGLGEGVMGRALEDTIYLSEIPFNLGTKQVASTLLEEWVHNKYHCEDFDRQMQSWLFDKILSIGEELNGEPI